MKNLKGGEELAHITLLKDALIGETAALSSAN